MTDKIQIAIGDWSNDGHGECDNFFFNVHSGHSVQEIREAYFQSGEKYPNLNPEKFCCDMESSTLSPKILELSKELGFDWLNEGAEFESWKGEDYTYAHPEVMAKFVAWFIGLSGPALELTPRNEVPTLQFYGYDKEKRHIGFIGYGLFSD